MDLRPLIVLGLFGGAGWLVWRELQAAPAKSPSAAEEDARIAAWMKANPGVPLFPDPRMVASPPVSVVDLSPSVPSAPAAPPNPYASFMDFYRRQLPPAPASTPSATRVAAIKQASRLMAF